MPEFAFSLITVFFTLSLTTALKPRPPREDMWTSQRRGYFAWIGAL